ncbi:chromate transporter [Halalkalibacter hemicellulosilyticus]|uniref:Chromate transporter n=1 Tax=Halalkalibacter hemicellulosilyticusJCM 9152 TaxID=1236971 RepID=W4QCQ3_9BACI|nr:chromate transporter [Halalkalibacter hemicellulosilyticus]GAE29836.1 chromate transporter [Halalkalibacter hemicellulosilyticusJCM 9152]
MKRYWDLFVAFFRSGILGFGGGPSAIPLVQKEVVDIYKWMNNDEFGDVLALGNTLPGPINTKMAGYIGYRVAGVLGMIVAVSASIVPTIFLMIILLASLTNFSDYAWVNGVTNGVLPVVGVMLALLTWDFLKNAKTGLGWIVCILLAVMSVVMIELFGLHPAILILILLCVPFFQRTKAKESVQEGGEAK